MKTLCVKYFLKRKIEYLQEDKITAISFMELILVTAKHFISVNLNGL